LTRQIYFDRVLVSDNEFSLAELETVHNYMKQTKYHEGVIKGHPEPEKTKFKLYSHSRVWLLKDLEKDDLLPDQAFLKKLMSLDMVPVLADHETELCINAHIVEKGGGMAFHNDSNYSCAATIYLDSVEGGEFEARISDDDGVDFILRVSPRATRVVVIKSDTEHRVRKVEDGVRRSIQVFVRYFKEDA
jgi:hypothetical protein